MKKIDLALNDAIIDAAAEAGPMEDWDDIDQWAATFENALRAFGYKIEKDDE